MDALVGRRRSAVPGRGPGGREAPHRLRPSDAMGVDRRRGSDDGIVGAADSGRRTGAGGSSTGLRAPSARAVGGDGRPRFDAPLLRRSPRAGLGGALLAARGDGAVRLRAPGAGGKIVAARFPGPSHRALVPGYRPDHRRPPAAPRRPARVGPRHRLQRAEADSRARRGAHPRRRRPAPLPDDAAPVRLPLESRSLAPAPPSESRRRTGLRPEGDTPDARTPPRLREPAPAGRRRTQRAASSGARVAVRRAVAARASHPQAGGEDAARATHPGGTSPAGRRGRRDAGGPVPPDSRRGCTGAGRVGRPHGGTDLHALHGASRPRERGRSPAGPGGRIPCVAEGRGHWGEGHRPLLHRHRGRRAEGSRTPDVRPRRTRLGGPAGCPSIPVHPRAQPG